MIAVLYKVEGVNMYGYCSSACTSMSCGWNKSTKTVIEPRPIRDIVIRKMLHSQMGEMPDYSGSRKYKRVVKLNNFDPRQKLQRIMTGERLSNLIQSNSNPCAVLLKSVEGMTIPVAQNLTVTGIENEIITSNSMVPIYFNKKEVTL